MRNSLDYKYSCMHGVHDSDEQQTQSVQASLWLLSNSYLLPSFSLISADTSILLNSA